MPPISHATHQFVQQVAQAHVRTNYPETLLEDYLQQYRKDTNNALYRATADKVTKHGRDIDTTRMIATLSGQSSKRLINTFSVPAPPFVIDHPTGMTTLTSNLNTMKEATQEYFEQLYKQQPEPQVPKLWLNMPVYGEDQSKGPTRAI